jgi:hypothetical protein
MKTLKYRSAIATITVAALSVFLFTACEKESDSPNAGNADRLSKFKRLTFSTGSATATTNSGSGTFIGGGSLTFTPPSDGGNTFSAAKADDVTFSSGSDDRMFTDPRSTGPAFGISTSFGTGGGDFTVDGSNFDLEFGLCAESNFLGFGLTPGEDTSGNTETLKVFIGIDGEFDETIANDTSGSVPIDHIVYILSYGESTTIAPYFAFDEGNLSGHAFGFLIQFDEGSEGTIYWLTDGDINISGEGVSISNGALGIFDSNDGIVGQENIPFSADFECISYSEEE